MYFPIKFMKKVICLTLKNVIFPDKLNVIQEEDSFQSTGTSVFRECISFWSCLSHIPQQNMLAQNDKTVVFLSEADALNRNVLACKILLHFMAFKNSYCNRHTKSVNTKTNMLLL